MPEIKYIRIRDLEFRCRVSGNEQDELVIFLHGFPETSYMWSDLMDRISTEGYYCLAPDMRGYSKNACPKGVEHYRIDALSQDIIDLADHIGTRRFHLVGHDWGAGIGWHVVYNNPDRIISWTALSIPHSRAFGKALRTDPEQKKKSRYIGWFLIPTLPEMVIRQGDFKRFRKLWKHSSEEELNDYLSVFRRKASLTAALNYYRANIGKGKQPSIGNVATPTLFIWGKYDLAVGATAAQGCRKYMEGDFTFVEVEGGHWLIQTNYKEVETAILNHLIKYKIKDKG